MKKFKKIWKHELKIERKQIVFVPPNLKIIRIATQGDGVFLWGECDSVSDQPLVEKIFHVFGTGADDIPKGFQYVGTGQFRYGLELVWHVYIEPEQEEIWHPSIERPGDDANERPGVDEKNRLHIQRMNDGLYIFSHGLGSIYNRYNDEDNDEDVPEDVRACIQAMTNKLIELEKEVLRFEELAELRF